MCAPPHRSPSEGESSIPCYLSSPLLAPLQEATGVWHWRLSLKKPLTSFRFIFTSGIICFLVFWVFLLTVMYYPQVYFVLGGRP